MRCIVEYREQQHPPLLTLYIHDAPHRRMHRRVLQRYRNALFVAGLEAGLILPIDYPVDLNVTFVNPTSPDLDNLLTALYQAIDGNTLRGPSLLADDGLIQAVSMRKMFTAVGKDRREPAMRLPRFVVNA